MVREYDEDPGEWKDKQSQVKRLAENRDDDTPTLLTEDGTKKQKNTARLKELANKSAFSSRTHI